jgi:hypothetical protein
MKKGRENYVDTDLDEVDAEQYEDGKYALVKGHPTASMTGNDYSLTSV